MRAAQRKPGAAEEQHAGGGRQACEHRVVVHQDVLEQLSIGRRRLHAGRLGDAGKRDARAAAGRGGTAHQRRLHGPSKRVHVQLLLHVVDGGAASSVGGADHGEGAGRSTVGGGRCRASQCRSGGWERRRPVRCPQLLPPARGAASVSL